MSARKPKPGTPALCDDEAAIATVEQVLRAGGSWLAAARAAGYAADTLRSVETRAAVDPRYAPIHARWERARADASLGALQQVRRAALGVEPVIVRQPDGSSVVAREGRPPDWRAAAWLLERLEPETYGARPAPPPAVVPANTDPVPDATPRLADLRTRLERLERAEKRGR